MSRLIAYFRNVLATLIEIKLALKHINEQLEEINRRSDVYFAAKSRDYELSHKRNNRLCNPPDGW